MHAVSHPGHRLSHTYPVRRNTERCNTTAVLPLLLNIVAARRGLAWRRPSARLKKLWHCGVLVVVTVTMFEEMIIYVHCRD